LREIAASGRGTFQSAPGLEAGRCVWRSGG